MVAFKKNAPLAVVLLAIALSGCTIALPNPLVPGGPFVLKGTADSVQLFGGGVCNIWRGDNDVVYHLFQDPSLDGAQFDQITAPGVRSRLLIEVRDDLQVGCKMGPIVVVTEILQVF